MRKYQPLEIGNLKCRLPLIQGGMGVGISLGSLAGAVAKEGAVGVISTAQIGFKEEDFDENPMKANFRAMEKEHEKARNLASGGVVGFNIMVATRNYEEYVKRAVELGADLIISGAGLPTDLPRYTEGSETKIAPIVSTDKSASVILKYWDKKYGRIPDLLVIEGPKAGGHLGFTREQLNSFTEENYGEEVRKILETVKAYEEKFGKKIPTALAGGIYSRDLAEKAFSLGVDAIQCATPFVTTWECDADIRYKEAYIRAGKEDIQIVKSPVGMPGRAIRNRFLQRVEAGERLVQSCHKCLKQCNPKEIPYCITDALIHAAKGEIDDGLLFCGAEAYRASKLRSVSQVISELLPEH